MSFILASLKKASGMTKQCMQRNVRWSWGPSASESMTGGFPVPHRRVYIPMARQYVLIECGGCGIDFDV